jgi:formylglycine-generating enzyme required for sulfatase activity
MDSVFISYSSKDRDFVGRLRGDLQEAGIPIWIDQTGLKPGTRNWKETLREALREASAVLLIASPNSRQSVYVQGELAIAEMYKCSVYPIWAAGDEWADSVSLDMVTTQYIDARGDTYKAAIPQIVEVLGQVPVKAEVPETAAETDFESRNPYKGLRAFREGDAGDFFGRETLINELVEALRERLDGNRLLAVIGPSGSGKSSVVMAGLLTQLREGALPGSVDWVYLDRMVPGAHPLESLCIVLANALSQKSNVVIRQDLDDPEGRGLHLLGCQVTHGTEDQRLVLFIDQFEELFTQTVNEDERQQFITLLVAAVTEPKGPITVILTLRADFYDRPMEYPTLFDLLQTHQAVPPMSLDDLRDVIEKPAALPDVQVTFEEGLVGDLLFEVRECVGGLPLLQFTLDQLFQHRDNHTLNLATYQDMGGLRGALARHAEATFDELPTDEHRKLARTLFLRLIEPGATEQDTTRRRADLTELELPDADQAQVLREVADAFISARLITTGEIAGKATIEVSHEALIREWERLGTWLHYAREDITTQRNVSEDAAAWIERGRKPDDDGLYRGAILLEKLAWVHRNMPSKDELAFIEASQHYERRRQRRLRLVWAGGVAIIMAFLLALVAIYSMRNEGLQNEVLAFEIRQERLATLVAGDVGFVPFGKGLSEQEIFVTVTKIAELNKWDKENPVIDAAYKVQYGVEMVQVPAGCFWMGSVSGNYNERPVHQVCFNEPFWIDRYEVTNGQFERLGGVAEHESSWPNPDQPRTDISWSEAQEFCNSRGAQLPTEAQWEYAARGLDSLVFPWGNKWNRVNAVSAHNSGGNPWDVGSKPFDVSWVGAYDLTGNVWEWVSTVLRDYPYDANDGRENTSDPNSFRGIRGGGFGIRQEDTLRAPNRYGYRSNNWGNDLGFRCARPD